MDTLVDQFELKQIGRFRGVMNAGDVISILPSLGPMQRLLSRRATATLVCGYEHLLCIHRGASRNRYRVKLLLWLGSRDPGEMFLKEIGERNE
jgi:hypothetical protein